MPNWTERLSTEAVLEHLAVLAVLATLDEEAMLADTVVISVQAELPKTACAARTLEDLVQDLQGRCIIRMSAPMGRQYLSHKLATERVGRLTSPSLDSMVLITLDVIVPTVSFTQLLYIG